MFINRNIIGNPTRDELRILAANLNPYHPLAPFVAGCVLAVLIAKVLPQPLPILLEISLVIAAGLATAMALSHMYGLYYLSRIEKDFGRGAANSMVAWHRNAKEGDRMDIEQIVKDWRHTIFK